MSEKSKINPEIIKSFKKDEIIKQVRFSDHQSKSSGFNKFLPTFFYPGDFETFRDSKRGDIHLRNYGNAIGSLYGLLFDDDENIVGEVTNSIIEAKKFDDGYKGKVAQNFVF